MVKVQKNTDANEEKTEPSKERTQLGVRINPTLQKIVRSIADKHSLSTGDFIEAVLVRALINEVKFKPELLDDAKIFSKAFDFELEAILDDNYATPLFEPFKNIPSKKGVIFDTNINNNSENQWEMLENNYVASYGPVKHLIEYLSKDDYVFFYQSGLGIIAAGQVTSEQIRETDDKDGLYKQVTFNLIPPPKRDQEKIKSISAKEIKKLLSKNFFWSKTLKVPYLSNEESQILLKYIKEKF